MKLKAYLWVAFCVFTFTANAQYVKLDLKNGKVGFTLMDDYLNPVSKVEPIYEDVKIYTPVRLGGILIGTNDYYGKTNWLDTEYVSSLIDPNDPSFTKIDTFINENRQLITRKLVMAKKNGKWGLIDLKGKEIMPFEYDLAKTFLNPRTTSADSLNPLIILNKGNEVQVVNQYAEVEVSNELLQKYCYKMPVRKMIYALEIGYFNHQLLVQKDGQLFDTLIHVKAKSWQEKVQGTKKIQKFYQAAYTYPEYYYRGGKLNVVNTQTSELLFPTWSPNISIEFMSGAFEKISMNPRNMPSITASMRKFSTKETIVNFVVKP